MAIVSDVEIRLRADIARLQQDLNAARRSVSGAVDDIKKTLAGMTAGFSLATLAKQVIDAQREFDKLNAALVTSTGSAEGAATAFAALQKFAATTPFSVMEATQAFIKLKNQGLEPSEAALRSYGNTASGANKSLDQFIEAVGDASRSQFERLQEFAIAAKQNGNNVAFTFQGVTKTVGNNSKEIQAYLQSLGNVQFAGAMERQANTLNGSINNLGDNWSALMRTISKNGAGEAARSFVTQLGGALNDLAAALDVAAGKATKEGQAMSDAGAIHDGLTATFKGLAAVGVLIAAGFQEIGQELGALAALARAVGHGEWANAKAIIAARQADMTSLKETTEAKVRAIGKSDQVAAASAAASAKNTGDQLAQYQVVLTAEQQRQKADQDTLEIRNKLNGVDAQTAGNLAKLKVALDTGAISQKDYSRYVALTNKEATIASTAYKEGAKALDLSTNAVKRREQAQLAANKADQAQLDFLHRTGQMDDATFIAKQADADVAALNRQKDALIAQRALLKSRYDTEAARFALGTQIEGKEQEIAAARKKREHDEFENEQKLYRLAINNTADLIEGAQQESATQRAATLAQKDELEALGLTGRQLAEVTAARLRDRAAALDRRAEIGIIQEVNDQLRQQADELRKQADLGLTKERMQEQQKFWGDIEQTAHDTFMSIGDGNKNMWQRMKETAKNIFFNWLYEMTVKKWIINIGTSISGPGAVAGIASSGTQDSGGSGMGGNIASYASLMKSGFSSAGASGASAGVSSSTTVGSMGMVAGGAVAGNMAGRAISNGYSVTGGSGNATVNAGTIIGTAIGYFFGGPVGGALLGGIVGGLVNRAFGYKAKEIRDAAIVGSLGPGGFSGDMKSDWVQKGGWFRSDKTGTDISAVDQQVAASLGEAYSAIKASSAEYAKALGVNADSIATRTQELNIKLSKDEAESTKAINAFFAGVSDTIAGEIIPNIGKFTHEGETASATLHRLATDFQAVEGVLATLGTTSQRAFGAVGLASLDARERLVALAGGIDALAQQTQFFADNFLTKAQQIAPAQRQLADGLAALGYANLQTKDDYAKAVMGLVDSGALATEQGAKLYSELMKLGPAFKAVADYTEELQAAARDAGRTQADAALNELRRAVDGQKAVAMAAYDAVMGRLNAGIESVNATIERTGNLSRALKAALGTVDSPAQQEGMRAAAQAQITASLAIAKAGGALPTAEDLRDALAALSNDASSQFSTLADYQREVARTNNELSQLGGMADGQLSTAERQLLVLQEQAALVKTASDTQLARFDAMVSNAQAQVSALAATNNTLNDIYGVVNSLQLQAAQVNYGQYQQTLGAEMLRQLDVPAPNYTPPSATINSDAAILAALQSLESRMANVETNTQRAAAASAQFAAQFDQVSAGGNALATEVVG